VLTIRKRVLCLALFLVSCAAAALGASGLWLDVPYIHQERDGCGSASLAMVLRYWQAKHVAIPEHRADPARIQRELYAAKPRGIYSYDMERYLRESGFEVFAFRCQWNDLRSHLAKGRPLIAGLKPKGSSAHYLVIVGLDPGDSEVLVNDPERGKLLHTPRAEFEKQWQGTGNWTLLAVPHQPE
jgi:ABC-type bacteriocin/lantibiotic exporter with double-glycine peptidase domain